MKNIIQDIKYGINNTKYRMLAFAVFIAVFSIQGIRYLELADDGIFSWYGLFITQLFNGCSEYIPEEGFMRPPSMWLIVVLCIPYIFSENAYGDLHGMGFQKVISYGKSKWWMNKVFWVLSETVLCLFTMYGVSFLTYAITAETKGGLNEDTSIHIFGYSEMFADKTNFYLYVFLIPFLCVFTLACWSTVMGMIFGPSKAFMIMSIYLGAGIYYLNPYTIGNQLMYARCDYVLTNGNGLKLGDSIWIDSLLIIAAVIVGLRYVKKYDFIDR